MFYIGMHVTFHLEGSEKWGISMLRQKKCLQGSKVTYVALEANP